jgi:hypothetical protein
VGPRLAHICTHTSELSAVVELIIIVVVVVSQIPFRHSPLRDSDATVVYTLPSVARSVVTEFVRVTQQCLQCVNSEIIFCALPPPPFFT